MPDYIKEISKVHQKKFKDPAEVQADFMEEFREMKELLRLKFDWISQVELKQIKERCDEQTIIVL